MDEHRQVAGGERRLLPRDRDQCAPRLGNDLLALRARDPGMVLDPLALKPLFGHPRCCRPDLALRPKLAPLRRSCAMGDPPITTQRRTRIVEMIYPSTAPPT